MNFMNGWNRLINWGEHHYKDQVGKERNRLISLILIFYTIILLFTDAFLLWLFFGVMLVRDADKYWPYFLPFMVPLVIAQLVVTGAYICKGIFGRGVIFSSTALFVGLAFVCWYAIFLGEDSQFYFLLLILLPLQFFQLGLEYKKLIYVSVGIILLAIVATTTYVHMNPPLYPFEDDINKLLSLVTWVIMTVSGVIGTYYFWKETQKAQHKLRSTTALLKEKDEILQQELKFAADIQFGILPRGEGHWQELNYHAVYQPAGKVSGDYFDIFLEKEHSYFLMTDISGHGVPAAFVTMMAKQVFHNITRRHYEPAHVFARANNELVSKITTQDYLTAFLVKVDSNYKVIYANAGHVTPFYYSAAKDKFYNLDTSGFMLAALEADEARFGQKRLQLQPGDRIFLFTDGVIEQKNEQDEQYSIERLHSLLREQSTAPIAEVHQQIMYDFHLFRGDVRIADDVTLLTIERSPQPG